MKIYSKSRKNIYISLLLSLTLAICLFWYILLTGFIGDDAYNSQIRGVIHSSGITIYQEYYTRVVSWMLGSGRFFPLHWYHVALYYNIQSELLLKSINLFIIFLDLFAFSLVINKITKSNTFAFLSTILAASFFQLRAWHDPILSFSSLIPLLFLFLFVSLYFYIIYIENNKIKYLLVSVLFHCIGLLTYEANYLFYPIYFLISFNHYGKFYIGIKKTLPILFPTLLIILFTILLKSSFNPDFSSTGYTGANFHLDILGIIRAFIIQLISGIPFSYLIFAKPYSVVKIFDNGNFIVTIILTIIFTLFFIKKTEIKNFKNIIILGTFLVFFPSIIIGISGHQQELIDIGYGYGYIPVYFQYFGVSLILLSFLLKLRELLNNKFLYLLFNSIIVIFFALSIQTQYGLNKLIATSTNDFYLYPRVLLGNALLNLPSGIDKNTIFIREPRYPYDNLWFFSTVLDKPLKIADKNFFDQYKNEFTVTSISNNINKITPIKDNFYIISYSTSGKNKGYAYSGILKEAYVNSMTNNVYSAYVKNLNYHSSNIDKVFNNEAISNVDFFKIINSQNQYYEESSRLDFILSKYSSDTVLLDWSRIYGKEGSDENNVRWSSGKSELLLVNPTEMRLKRTLKFKVATGYSEQSKFSVLLDGKQFIEIQASSHPEEITIDLELLPHKAYRFNFISGEKIFPNTDPRKIVFGIFNFRIQTPTGS